ncbi:Aspartic peptidase domain containing protein [Rhypophila sp. PSN 637]
MRRRRFPILRLGTALPTLTFPILVAAQGKTIQLAWTTDARHGLGDGKYAYGPDGPWQALAVSVGTTNSTFPTNLDLSSPFTNNPNFIPRSGFYTGAFVPLYPSGGGLSILLASQSSQNQTTEELYNPSLSPSANRFGTQMGNADDWQSWTAVNEDSWGEGIFDLVTLGDKLDIAPDDGHGGGYFFANATLNSLERFNVLLPDGRKYMPPVGILGLGIPSRGFNGAPNDPEPGGILLGLKREGKIGYAGFGMHLGSVAYNQPGSLILGGYEKNRVLGEVGIFRWDSEDVPYMFLLDVQLGVQSEKSGFSFETGGSSIWAGPTDNEDKDAENLRKRLGAKEGAAVVVPNPGAPYIYLPKGTCEAAAKRLPVRLNESLGLYIWDREDSRYESIMRSSAYMSFVLADRSAKNVTIKVPFQLLNLTLEAPLVDEPTPYFPCQSLEADYGFWTLGRAFLQAAFLGVDLERNQTYLAQAPGPRMEQSIVRNFVSVENGGDSAGLESNNIGEFESSWSGVWLTSEETGKPAADVDGSTGLSAGAIAGILVGVAAGVAMLGFIVWMLKKRSRKDDRTAPPKEKIADDNRGEWSSSPKVRAEMDTERDVSELGVPTAHEMESPGIVHEAPDMKREYVELPADVPLVKKD